MIKRYNVQHIHKRKNKQTTVAATDPKQAMRSIIHYEHGHLPELITWSTMFAYDNHIEQGEYSVDGLPYTVCIAYIPSEDEQVIKEKNTYGFSGFNKEIKNNG